MIKCRVTLDENAFQREIEKRDQIDVPMDCVRNKMSEIVRNMIIKDGLEDAVHQCCGAFHVEGFLNIESIFQTLTYTKKQKIELLIHLWRICNE